MDQSKGAIVTKNRTVIKRTNQKMALLLKIESDTVTKNNGPIRRDLEERQVQSTLFITTLFVPSYL